MIQREELKDIRIEDMAFDYRSGVKVFDGVHLDLKKTPRVFISGRGEQGRSTLLKLIVGLENPTRGQVLMNNQNIADLSFEELAPFRLSIGYGFDMGGLINNRSLFDNLMLPIMYHNILPVSEAHERCRHFLQKFGLADVQDLRPASVTPSLRKSCLLARSLILKPNLLLLDDPDDHLDPRCRKTFIELIEEHRENHGLRFIVATSRNDTLAKDLDCQVFEIRNRQLLAESTHPVKKAVGL